MPMNVHRRQFLKMAAAAGGALATSAALSACGGGGGSTGGESKKTLSLGYIMSADDPGDLGAKKFKELVEKNSNGSITVNLSGDSLLGGEQDLWEGMQLGSVDMAVTGVGPISFFTPQYAGVQMYYAIRDQDHLDKVFNGDIGDEIADALLQAKGGRILGWWHRGARHVTANKAIRVPADLKGLKIRVPEGRTYLEAWQALGASPTPMALGELFTALQQGVVDAQENPLSIIDTSHYDEVQSTVSLTQHQIAPYLFAISDQVWTSLSAAQQKAVQKAAADAGDYEKQIVDDSEGTFRDDLKQRGMTIVEDVDRDAFSEVMVQAAKKLEGDNVWQSGLYQRIRDVR
jgi:tripartite ATP-independent transporter DctP family solute receptor